MQLHDLLQWWNTIYLVPLFFSLVWIVVMAFGGLHAGHIGGGHDVGGTAHAGHDVGHIGHSNDIGHTLHHFGHSHDAGHGHSHDASHADGSHENSFGEKIMLILGLNQAPISLLMGIFAFCWGIIGLANNQLLEDYLKLPAIYIWPSLGITFLFSATITRMMAAFVAKMLPTEETFGVSRSELVGTIGKVVYTVTDTSGTISISDRYGTVHRELAKTGEGEEALSPGSEVLVIDFDNKDKRFIVKSGGL